MNRILVFITCFIFINKATAQTTPGVQAYGKIDKADLELAQCDFEKDANGEVLFDKAEVTLEGTGRNLFLNMQRHTRIKVFNDFGKNLGNVHIEYYSFMDKVVVNDLQAETINLVDGKMEVTPIDKKTVYTQQVDKTHTALIFTFPNVKAGSIIEYKYRVASQGFPTWDFQNYIPTRYSEIEINVPSYYNFKSLVKVKQPYVKDIGNGDDAHQVKAMANIHSMPIEPYMGSRNDNLQRIEYMGINTDVSSWSKIGDLMARASDFGIDLNKNLTGEDLIIKKAKAMASADDKIAFIFDTVKNSMKWSEYLNFYTIDGTVKAWDKKLGNSAEINMILYHLLKKSGVKVYPLVVCTKNYGKINPGNATLNLFNNTVVYAPVDSTKSYVMDASSKYNLYNTIPSNILNTFGLSLDPAHNDYKMVFIQNEVPAMQSIYLNAEIKPEGKIEGNAEITSASYNKINVLRRYYTDGEKRYVDSLHLDNNLKILSFKIENMDVDSLPSTQKIDFGMDLSGSDGNYIYFNPNLFNTMGANPFHNEERYSDIDMGYLDNYSVYGVYKLPAGFKVDAMPKTLTMVMPDQSIIFKRTVVEDNGTLLVKYVLNHRKTIYFRENYQDLRGFYKQMYELMNEQIVLKKS